MAVQYLYIYDPADFVGGLPAEQSAQAAGSPPFTLTLAPDAQPVLIAVTENAGDVIFDEIDGTQTLAAPALINGTTWPAGTSINTAYDLTNSATGHKVTSFHMGGDGYQQGAVDGLVSTVPLVPGQSYTFDAERTSHQQNNAYDQYFACFASGALIRTATGLEKVEDLRVGSLVWTEARGVIPVCWIGRARVLARGDYAPVRIFAGQLGLTTDLVVSQQHRMVVEGAAVELVSGSPRAFVPARALVAAGRAALEPGGSITYHHLLFDRHEILMANGALTESLLPTPQPDRDAGDPARTEADLLFPDLAGTDLAGGGRADPGDTGLSALPCLRGFEAATVLQARSVLVGLVS